MSGRRTAEEWRVAGLVLVQRRRLWCTQDKIVSVRAAGDVPEHGAPAVPSGLRLAVYDLALAGLTTEAHAYFQEIRLTDAGTAALNQMIFANRWGLAHLDQIAVQGLVDA